MSDFDICISVNVYLRKLPPVCFTPSVVYFFISTLQFHYFYYKLTYDHDSIESDQLYSGYVSALVKPRQVCTTYFEVYVLSVNMHSL